MKKILLFSSTKAIMGIDGEDDELYVNFYLVLNRDYIFTFLIDAPNLACSNRNPIKLWKQFLIMLEEEYVKYMRRYETYIMSRKEVIEQKPCNDTISREAAIEQIQRYGVGCFDADDFSPEECERFVIHILETLPPVIPQQKIGRWINDSCSICNYGVQPWNNTPYCPNCGAKMQEVEE